MKRIALLVLMALLAATPLTAGTKLIALPGGATTPNSTQPLYGGGLTVTKTVGPELLTLDATCTGWTAGGALPINGWSCVAGTLVHAGGGGTTSVTYTYTIEKGTTYEVSQAVAWTASSWYLQLDSADTTSAGATRGAAGTYTERIQYSGAGGSRIFRIIPASTLLDATFSGLSVRAVTSQITPSESPLILSKTLADATANEAVVSIVSNQTGAGGNKTTLRVNSIGSGTGTEYMQEWYADGTQVGFVTNTATGFAASLIFGQYFSASRTASGSAPAYNHAATLSTWGSIYKATTNIGAMNGTDTVNIFDAALTDGAITGSDNYVNAFNAENYTSADAQAIHTAVNVGTGWDYAIKAATGLVIHTPQAVTCADDAAGTNAALTITPTAAYIELTSADAHGCNVTMGETGMVAGTVVTICVVSVTAGAVNFADSAGVTELAGAFASNVNDCITLRYGNTTTWREVSRSAN